MLTAENPAENFRAPVGVFRVNERAPASAAPGAVRITPAHGAGAGNPPGAGGSGEGDPGRGRGKGPLKGKGPRKCGGAGRTGGSPGPAFPATRKN